MICRKVSYTMTKEIIYFTSASFFFFLPPKYCRSINALGSDSTPAWCFNYLFLQNKLL